MNIVYLVQMALDEARSRLVDASTPGQLHACRSRNFVEGLANLLRNVYCDNPDQTVFSKYDERHRFDFGLNELLFDITVCHLGETRSASGNRTLRYVSKGIWAIESELARDSRQALFDFNKLVLSAAEQKLFIGPHTADDEGFLRTLAAPAGCCSGAVHAVLIPHPDAWDAQTDSVQGWRFEGGSWVVVPS